MLPSSRLLALVLLIGLSHPAGAQPVPAGERERFDRNVAEITRMWDAVRTASPEFSRLFCSLRSRRDSVCVPDWEGFRSPIGGWRLIDPARCEVAPTPCSLGPRLDVSRFGFTGRTPPPDGPLASWLPCDVYPAPGDPSTLRCDDTCGCTILMANCAGTWSCNSNECSCGP